MKQNQNIRYVLGRDVVAEGLSHGPLRLPYMASGFLLRQLTSIGEDFNLLTPGISTESSAREKTC